MFDSVRAGPLVFLLLVAIPLLLVTLHASAAALGWLIGLPWRFGVPYTGVLTRWGDAAAVFREIGRMPQVGLSAYYGLPVGMALVLGGTMGLVLLLGDTLGRCRVRRVQVLRVFAYVALALVIVQPAVVLASVTLVVVLAPRALPPTGTPVWWTVFVSAVYILAATAPFGCFLSLGLKHYLKIPRAWLVGLTAVFVGALAMVTIVLAYRTL